MIANDAIHAEWDQSPYAEDSSEAENFAAMSIPAFSCVWDNSDDAAYDEL